MRKSCEEGGRWLIEKEMVAPWEIKSPRRRSGEMQEEKALPKKRENRSGSQGDKRRAKAIGTSSKRELWDEVTADLRLIAGLSAPEAGNV